jgi:hypothetical protein
LFAAEAILFTVFTSERNKNDSKHKKIKQRYKPDGWEAE